jgi:hypothetical protein
MADREAKVVVVNTDIHQRLKVLAAKKGTTIQTLTEEAIRRLLMSEAQKEA